MEQSPEMKKLLKLKEAIKTDLEKKTGKKIGKNEDKKQKIQLSEDIKKRILSDQSLPLHLGDVRTPLDIEKACLDIETHKVTDFIDKNADTLNNRSATDNLKSISLLLSRRFDEAVKNFGSLYAAEGSDYYFYNLLLARMLSGEDVEKEIVSFLRENTRSVYPLFLMIFYSLFRYKNFQITKKIVSILLKTEPNELHALFFYMLQSETKEIVKYGSILYRKNEYKEFQNIAKLFPYLLSKDGSGYQLALDALAKKSYHLCSRIYNEYLSRENLCTADELAQCPLGIFVAGRKALQASDTERATRCAKRLLSTNDPFGHLLDIAIEFGNGHRPEALSKLHQLLLPFERVTIVWGAGRTTLYKGIGTLSNPLRKNLVTLNVPSDFSDFQQYIEGSLSLWDDFEVFLYPFEEFRTFFGFRWCMLAHKENT